jgi:NADPH:quinone reductase-like Zn-dependent oxidoreductase
MKAAVFTQYGPPDVLHLQEIQKPSPKNNEVLVRVRSTAVNSGDWRLRRADPFAVRFLLGLMKPKINVLGSVLSGEIESVGKDVKLFKAGDKVFGHTDMSFGAYAQYKSFPEKGSLALRPAHLTDSEAAAIPFGGTTALHFLKKAAIQPGQRVLVYGASGAVGSAAIQLAKSFGAKVTGVCSTGNVELVKSLGADDVIDYTIEDFTTNGNTYDVIFDTVNKVPFSGSLKKLTKNGLLILSAAGLSEMLRGLWVTMTSTRKVLTGVISHTAEDIIFLKKLIDEGKLQPVVDKSYSLEQIAEAHTYVEKGHKKGNVVITIN